jgi:ankyrin repeat protein
MRYAACLLLAVCAPAFFSGCHAPIYEAAARNDGEGIKQMIQAGTPADFSQEGNRRTALHVATARGGLEAAQALLDGGAKPDAQDYHGNTPLMIAASHGRTSILRAMLAKHPPLDTQDWRGATAVWWACVSKNEVGALMLVRAGANPHIKDTWGRDALWFADINGFGNVLRNPPAEPATPAPAPRLAEQPILPPPPPPTEQQILPPPPPPPG